MLGLFCVLFSNFLSIKIVFDVFRDRCEIPQLQQIKELNPQPSNLVLSTFFIASREATNIKDNPPFDYVIVDEASQALLAMYGASKLLGKKNIYEIEIISRSELMESIS